MSYEAFRGNLAPVMDLDYDLNCSFHTPETLKKKFQVLATLGFKSINIVVPPPDSVDYTNAGRIGFLPENPDCHLERSRAQFKNPFREAVALAKGVGLRVDAVFKPYEGGGVFTSPVGHHILPPRPQLDCLGGCTTVTSFIAEHPDWRLKRRDSGPDDTHLPVTSLEFAFLMDELTEHSPGGRACPALSDAALRRAKQWTAELYTSDDNAAYTRMDGVPTITREIRRLRISDANNFTLRSSARCLVVTLSGFIIPNRFLAARFFGGDHRLLILPNTMVRARSGRRVLKTTVAPTLRHQPTQTREFKKRPPTPADFTTCGFEFAESWPGLYGWWDTQLFGIARGYEPYIRGALCEAVPGVRRHWLEQLKTLIDCGCDGVDIRLPSHCSGIRDFVNYGFNDELLRAFRRRHGRLPRRGKRDFLHLMRVRGDFFVQFLADARRLLHRHGRTLQVHMRDCLCHPSLGPTYHENGMWYMPKILPDWKRVVDLCDRVILSDNLSDSHYAGPRKDVAVPIKRYASQHGKKVWAYCYLQQGHSFNRDVLNDFATDPYLEGLYLYEVVYNDREKDGILEVVDPQTVRVVARNRALFDELLTPTPRAK